MPLDENLPRLLTRELAEHEVQTVAEAGSTKVGDLRPLAGKIASAITSVAPGHLVRVPAREPTAGPDPST